MAGAIIGFSLVAGNLAVNEEKTSEVEQNGDVVLQRILRTVGEKADAIAFPAAGETAASLLLHADGTEYLFYQHGDRIAMAEDGTVSYLTTDNVLIDYLTFLHYGNPDQGEGVSVVFRAGNAAIGTEVRARQYTKTFRGSAGLRPGKCQIDGDCGVGEKCCASGECVPSANSCTPVSPVCNTVADCDTATFYPQCDTSGGNCDWDIPTCNAGNCEMADSNTPCGTCSRCGDTDIDPLATPPEECDDGNADNTDACTTLCQDAECGDGYRWDGTEACDDGNTVDGDGCSAACVLEDLCVGGAANGTQEGDEECDKGDPPSDGTCDANCNLTYCGDGTVQSPNGQGLAESCEVDGDCAGGEFCSGCKCVDDSECGNGIVEGAEECDDGKRCSDNGDPCQNNSDCNSGATCVGRNIDGCTTPNVCVPDETPEATCNDSVDNDCDGLIDCADTANCPVTTSCGATAQCVAGGTCCGNGSIEAPEECDDGNITGGDGCDAQCKTEAPGTTECSDGVDNADADGLVDCIDPDPECISAVDWVTYQQGVAILSNSHRVIDVDGDSELDIVYGKEMGAFQPGALSWYKNDGANPPGFTNSVIDGVCGGTKAYVDAADVDKDLDIDVTAVCGNIVSWYDNDGSENFTKKAVGAVISGARGIIKDMDGDTEMDILIADTVGLAISWFQNDGSESFTKRDAATGVTGLTDVYPALIDGDANLDIVATAGNNVYWYKSDGASPPAFTLQSAIDSAFSNASAVHVADLDADTDMDVIAGNAAGAVRWFRNDGTGSFSAGTTIETIGTIINALYAAPINSADAFVDITAASAKEVKWYESNGGSPPTFTARSVETTGSNDFVDVSVADINGDGKMDLIRSARDSGGDAEFNVAWLDFAGAGQCYPLDDDESS